MRRRLCIGLIFGLFVAIPTLSQQSENFDILKFSLPKGWQTEVDKDSFQLGKEDANGGVLLTIFKSVPATENSKENFSLAWESLVKPMVTVKTAPQMQPSNSENGWTTESGFARYESDGKKGMVLLVTASGGGKMINLVGLMNTDAYQQEIGAFMNSIVLPKVQPVKASPMAQPQIPQKSGFKYTENRFNDGWTAVEQEDWVRVTKGNATVLIHYALPDLRSFNNLDEASVSVWDKIVAPRYSNLKNFFSRKSWYADGDFMNGKYFVEGDVTDPSTGRRAYVALYKDGNAGKWIEFIMPDKQSFQREFTTVYTQDGTNWAKLSAMVGYNKFAVAPQDISGAWKSSSAAGVELYNIYTGNSVGMATTSSSNEFTFAANGGYTEIYKSASGVGAGLNYYGQTNKGRFSVSNSSMLTLTNRFKGQAHEFSAYFEAVKGGRILHLIRGSIEDLHLYKVR